MSVDMFAKHSRRGVDIDQIVPRGKTADQYGALAEYIDEASNWMDHICQQILTATYDTVMTRVNVDRFGNVNIHPRYRPVVALTAFEIGASPSQMQALTNLAAVGFNVDQSFTVPANGGALPVFSSQGPIQFGPGVIGGERAWVQYTYINGYPVTSLTGSLASGAMSITVPDTTGIIAGNTYLTIYTDPGHRTTFLAGTVSTTSGPGTVACPAAPWAVANNGPYPVMVSALPTSCISACALATRALIKDANPGAATDQSEKASTVDDDLAEAAALLRDFVAPVE
jgi:hypothetical protein